MVGSLRSPYETDEESLASRVDASVADEQSSSAAVDESEIC
jgi:hypothetical protein